MKNIFFVILTLIIVIFFFSCQDFPSKDEGLFDQSNDSNMDSGKDEGLSDWPSDSNVGLIDPDILTPISDTYTVSTNSETVENLEIDGLLIISADNVTVKNCRVYGGTFWAIVVDYNSTGVVIENCEIGLDHGEIARTKGVLCRAGSESVIKQNYMHNLEDGVYIQGQPGNPVEKATVQDNYITELLEDTSGSDPSHNDGIQIQGLANNILVSHNFIELPNQQDAAIMIIASNGDLNNITVDNNLLNGGSFTLYTRFYADTSLINIAITNNYFMEDYIHGIYSTEVTYNGGIPYVPDTVYGNVWYATGETVSGILGGN